jgi:hypothetical protein
LEAIPREPLNVLAPETARVCDLTDTKFEAPELLIEAKAVPEAGVETVLNLPVRADTLPVEAPVKSKTPVEVSTPKVLSKPLIQFWRISKLELIVILDPEIESDPKISVTVTDAIFLVFFTFFRVYISRERQPQENIIVRFNPYNLHRSSG